MTGMQGNSHGLAGYAPVSHLPPLKPGGGVGESGHAASSSPADLECPVDQQQQQQQARHDWNDKSANAAWKYQSFQVL
jgi:hypothetical protein